MDFQVLGPFDVREDGRSLPLGGPKQRALLAVLVLHANETVSSARLIDHMWGSQPPDSAMKALHFYISRLRAVLEPDRPRGAPARMLVTRGSGYELRVDPAQIDLHRFERLLGEADAARDAGDHVVAAGTLRAALSVWRGPPLGELGSQPFARAAVTRIDELRMSALEQWCEEELALGHHARLVGELERLVAEYPLRERFCGQLMLALYRCGRQAEALNAYRGARAALVDELGIEPSPHLQRLERAILAQDSALEPPPIATDDVASAPTPPREESRTVGGRHRRRRLVRAVTAALVIGALTAGGLFALVRQTTKGFVLDAAASGTGSPRLVPSSIAVIDPQTNAATSVVQLGVGTQVKDVGQGAVWVANPANRTISRIDLITSNLAATIGIPVTPDVVATGEGSVWVGSRDGPLLRIDPVTNATEPWDVLEGQDAIEISPGTVLGGSMAVGHGSLWLGVSNVLTVWRTDAHTGMISATLRSLDPWAMVASSDALWVLDAAGRISRIDAATNEVVAAIRVGSPATRPGGLAVGEGAVWVLDVTGGRVVRIDPTVNEVVAAVPLNLSPLDAVTTGGGSVWVTEQSRGAVRRIDPATNQITHTIQLGHSMELGTIEYGGGLIWVAIGEPLGR